jgi:AmmeMemoRadiSam system protein B
MEYPKLRYGLEAIPAVHDGRNVIVLRDRLGFSNEFLLISSPLLELLMQMNGENSIRDLQYHFFRSTGEMLYGEKIEEVLNKLDEHFFLENERFIQHVAQTAARFRDDPLRHMAHAGKSYPDDPQLLRRQLESFFSPDNGGPGFPQPNSSCRRLHGLAAPHIDIQAGGPTFAYAYKACCEAKPPRTWVILGTGHEPVENYFALTVKDFETPLGTVRCDDAFCKEMIRKASRDLLAGEYNHRQEHTIEFQAVFLAYVQPEARIVPVLCSFSHENWEEDREFIDGIAGLMRRIADDSPDEVGFIASVDLAHVGPRYGHNFHPHAGTVAEHMEADRKLMENLERCDASGFIQTIEREANRRNICGVAPLYMLAKVLEGRARGKLLHHSQTCVDQQNSFVTFASMAFEEM